MQMASIKHELPISASQTLLPLRGSPGIQRLKRGVVSVEAILRQQPHMFADHQGVIVGWIESRCRVRPTSILLLFESMETRVCQAL
jgi:hypothetical protein